MCSYNVQRRNYKWVLLILPLAITGCSDEAAKQARELQARLDEAHVRIEAQAAHSAGVERRLIAALKSSRRADQQIPVLQKTLGTRTQQLNALQKQRQALIQDQQHLRRALTQAHASTRQLNQHLLLASQQNQALHHRVNALDTWIRQQSAGALSQSKELEKLRTNLEITRTKRDHLHNTLALRATELAEQVKQLNQNLGQATQNIEMLETRIEDSKRARAYLTDKLAAANASQQELASKQSESTKQSAQQLDKQRMTITERDRQHREDQQLLKELKSKIAILVEQSTIPAPELKAARSKLAECARYENESNEQLIQLKRKVSDLNRIIETNLKQIGDIMSKASACATSQVPK
jgi:chromosome segregation ATPase